MLLKNLLENEPEILDEDEAPMFGHGFYYLSRVNSQIAEWIPDNLLVPVAKNLAGYILFCFYANGTPREEMPPAIANNIEPLDDGFWSRWASENQYNCKFLMNCIFSINRELKWRMDKVVDLKVLVLLNHCQDRLVNNKLFEKYVPEGSEPTTPPCPDGSAYTPDQGNLLEQWMIVAREEWVNPSWTKRGQPSWWEATDLAEKSVLEQIADYEAQVASEEEGEPDDEDQEDDDMEDNGDSPGF